MFITLSLFRSVDKVDDLMDDVNENMQMIDEVGQAMSQQIGPVMDEVFIYLSHSSNFISLFIFDQCINISPN